MLRNYSECKQPQTNKAHIARLYATWQCICFSRERSAGTLL